MPSQPAAKPDLIAHLRALIQHNGGRIAFRDFMQEALYHPQLGYYQKDATQLGPQGDFYTAVSATPVFGRILARFLARLRGLPGAPADFRVIEFGGHRGRLRADVLAELPDLDYRVVEAGDPWPGPFAGCVLSNEFLDALPVHRVAVRDGRWCELYVVDDGGRFAWAPGPPSDPRLGVALAGLPVDRMEGYETEVNLAAPEWMRRIATTLRQGHVVTIDYGHERAEYFSPHRPRGTLRTYHRHRIGDDPFVHVGEQDLTAHVEFTSLIEAGRAAGLAPVRFTDLAHFLVAEGAEVIREIGERTAGAPSRERQGLHQLLHPGLMGAAFRVLVQEKRPAGTAAATPPASP